MKANYNIENSSYAKKKSHLLRNLIRVAAVIVLLSVIALSTWFGINKYQQGRITIKTIKEAWSVYDYQKVYELSKAFLQNDTYNNTALTYYSYACFYLAQAQTDTQQAQSYLDECINNIRVALYEADNSLIPQLQYMLGLAYFSKNTITTHYYADLAVKYLLLAKENGYEADDIAEYLGLSYASLGMTMESISAFTEALLVRESDSLLLSIAEQYYKAKELNASEQYLFRIIKNSDNEDIVLKSENLLGNIYIDKEDYDAALEEFENVLKKNENSADAHYGIGVIYEKQGNIVKARAEWRKALKIQVNHPGALQKMSEN
ncbi:TPR repeat-containing protein [Treponema bryantii]|uniref:TPR repeat-containing protein n=1 Tax=Treponema bryantii TaxID=163 RepID=A0A1I3KCP9_9SPIR|nr:tetratricopeptide repeat protein [Treponema bryantii]SFI70279.1 TPR repeat-containing protein [Treponema bryantii]